MYLVTVNSTIVHLIMVIFKAVKGYFDICLLLLLIKDITPHKKVFYGDFITPHKSCFTFENLIKIVMHRANESINKSAINKLQN